MYFLVDCLDTVAFFYLIGAYNTGTFFRRYDLRVMRERLAPSYYFATGHKRRHRPDALTFEQIGWVNTQFAYLSATREVDADCAMHILCAQDQ
jgi:hypothetical protein